MQFCKKSYIFAAKILKFMKKSILFLSILSSIFVLTGCTETKIIREEYCYFNRNVVDFVIPANSWVWDSEASFYYYRRDLSELTNEIYNDGSVCAYLEYNSQTADAFQVALPAITNEYDPATKKYYQQRYDFLYGYDLYLKTGWVEVQLSNTDMTKMSNLQPAVVRVSMQW